MTTRGIPMIYYGDEIGMTGGDDPDNRRDFPGGWKEDSANAFEASGRSAMQEDLVQYVRTLTHLRAATPALRGGALVHLLVEDDAYAFARISGGSRVIVVFNEGAEPATLHILLDGTGIPNGTRLENLLATTPPAEARLGALDLHLPGHSVAVYR
jgi:glycosidase